MKPVLEIQWIYLALGAIIGTAMFLNGAYRVRKYRRLRAEAEAQKTVEIKTPKTLKEKRNAWYAPELRLAYRILVNGLALVLGCVFLALGKITGL